MRRPTHRNFAKGGIRFANNLFVPAVVISMARIDDSLFAEGVAERERSRKPLHKQICFFKRKVHAVRLRICSRFFDAVGIRLDFFIHRVVNHAQSRLIKEIFFERDIRQHVVTVVAVVISRYNRVHVGRGEFVIVVGVVVIGRNSGGDSAALGRISYPHVFCVERGLMRVETSEAVRTHNGTLGQIMRHDVDDAAHAIGREAFGHVTFVDFDAVNFVNGNIVNREVSVAVIDRHTINKHLHIFAFHAADIDFTFAAHASRLANFHARRTVRSVCDGGAGALKFRGIHDLDRFGLGFLVDGCSFVDSFALDSHFVEDCHSNLRIIRIFIYRRIRSIIYRLFRCFLAKNIVKIRDFFGRFGVFSARRFLRTRCHSGNRDHHQHESCQFVCKNVFHRVQIEKQTQEKSTPKGLAKIRLE